jgi:hypothetical protein
MAIHVIVTSTHGYHPPATMVGFTRPSKNLSKRFEVVAER